MEEGGMSDMQFKCYVRKLFEKIEDVSEDSSKEELWAVIIKLRKALEEDLKA